MIAEQAADLELTIRRTAAGYAADLRFTPSSRMSDADLAADVPLPLDPTALLQTSLDAAAYGRLLSAQLFADKRLRAGWAKAQAFIAGASTPLRLRLRLRLDPSAGPSAGSGQAPGADDLHALRWETLRDPARDMPLALDQRVRLSRYPHSDDLTPLTIPPRHALRALLAVASPDGLAGYGLAEVDVAGEVERGRAALDSIETTVLPAPCSGERATLAAIREALQSAPDIFVLVCHGSTVKGRPYLYLERADGGVDTVSGADFVQAIAQLERRPLLVVLAACRGAGQSHADGALAAVGPALARAGVAAVLAMQGDISMAAVEVFLPALFRELLHDGQIDRAVAAARFALRDDPDWWLPVLFLRQRDGALWQAAPPPADPLALLESLPLATIPDLAPLPPGSRMPFARNPLFVGRTEDLRWLAATLKGGATAAIGQVAAATGLGGIGKTNLATEFVHRYGQFFAGGVYWLSFADPAAVPAEVAACGAALDLPGFAALKLDEQVQQVQAAWQQPIPRLLVFDNCDETTPGQAEALIQQWKPSSGGCRVLITSRRAGWSKSLGVTALPLGVLARAESVALLRKHRPDLAADEPALDAIAQELGDLPLALHLAGSFLETYHDSPAFGDPADFLAELRDQRLLDHDALKGIDVTPSPTNHELHVARSFALSYERLNPNDPVDAPAIRLLARAACLAPGEPIPRDLLLATLAIVEDDRAALRQAEKGLVRLVTLGLLDREQGEALALHRLLHAFVRELADDPEAQGAVEEALISMSYQLNETGFPAAMQPIAAHLRYATDRTAGRDDKRAATLCSNLAYNLEALGDYAAARPLYERALAIYEQALGPNHPDTALSLNNLAALFRAQGDDAAARPLYERALAIYEQALGPSHPDTASSLNNLALLLDSLGDYAAARPLYERALAIYEQALGPNHPDTALSLNNLAALFRALGDDAAARPLYERALAIREQALGPSHPDTALSLNNLAALLDSQGDYAAARPLYERALAICEQALGPSHPDTALSLNNLAVNCYYQGELEQAADLMRRALSIREQRLGPDHPDTQSSRQSLAAIEQRLAGNAAPPSAEAQIAQITQEAEAAVTQVLAAPAADRVALQAELEAQAQWAAEGEAEGSPYLALATHLRALAAQLRDADQGQGDRTKDDGRRSGA